MGRTLLCACLALLGACDAGKDPATAAIVEAAAAATPADPGLARTYAQTCKACHVTPGTGAPMTGDRTAWAPRVAQGLPVLLDHTLRGYKGMPPMGACMDCGEKEFEALIRFMAGLDG
jgi:cytochrome c5